MVNKITGIALVLIVAIPILLGYGMAFDEETRTGYETTDQVNVTDYTLNATSPIYTVSYSPMNNQQMRATVHWINQGVTETSLISPNYNRVAANSSLPILAYGGYSQSLTAAVETMVASSLTVTDPATNGYVGIKNINPTLPVDFDFEGHNYNDPLAAGLLVEFCTTGDGSEWTVYYNGEKTGDDLEVYGTATNPAIVHTRVYTTLSPRDLDNNALTTYYINLPCTASVRLTYSDSTTEAFYVEANTQILREGNTVIIGDDSYSSVSDVAIATAYGTDTIMCNYTYATGQYADPSYGWTETATGNNPIIGAAYWFNGSLNNSVTMMLNMPVSTSTTLTAGSSLNAAYSVTIARASNGTVTVGGTTLGNYQYMSVTVTGNDISVSGIASWPNMRSTPVLINTVTVTTYANMETFAGIWIDGSATISYRVDSASVYSGDFAITQNYTLNMDSIWPSSDYTVAVTTVGIYGDSITFGGNTYPVTNGTITVDGSKIRLLKAAFSSTYDADSSTWSNTINGYEVSTSATASTITFGGDWSFTLQAYRMEEVTSTELVWQPGQFAWNGVDSSFALMGLITCVGVFIGLGMYGRRSGAKVGTLMLICGGAALIFLALI